MTAVVSSGWLVRPRLRLQVILQRLRFAIPSFALVPVVGAALLIVLWVIAHVWASCRALREFDDHIGDGPFQLFNPLRRIAAGQTGGIDFQYFHGIAIPYLHYPGFALLGKDLFASEATRYALSAAAYLGAFLFVFGCATRRASSTLILTALALVLTERACPDSLALPGVNLIGLRSTCPLLVLGTFLAGLRPSREAVAVGMLAGLGFTLGTDHGVATAGMIVMVGLGRMLIRLPGGTVRHLSYTLLAGFATAACVLLLIGGRSGATGALQYALVDLPKDQFWFFGAPPNKFLHFHQQLFSERSLLPAVIGPLATAIAMIAWMRHRSEAHPIGVILLGAMAYAIVSCVGYFGYCSSHYTAPALRMLVVVGLIVGWRAVAKASASPEFGAAVQSTLRWLLLGFLATFILIGPTTSGRSSAIEARAALGEIRSWVEEAAANRCPLGPRFRAHLNSLTAAIDADRARHGITRPPVIWSTYAGILEDHYGVFNPGSDYLIHAVGPARRDEYLTTFRRSAPDYVCTFRRSIWPWEESLQNNCWPFYEELVANYEPLGESWAFRLWKRRSTPWITPDNTAGRVTTLPERPDRFTVPVPSDLPPGWGLTVEVEYEAVGPARGVPILGGLPRFLLHPHDCANETPISLPPYRTNWAFAVYPIAGKTPSFFAGAASLTGGKVRVTAVHIRRIPADGRERYLHDEPNARLP